MIAKKTKLAGTKHTCPCVQKTFPSDSRFTRCELCGKARFYTGGYKGEMAWIIKHPEKYAERGIR